MKFISEARQEQLIRYYLVEDYTDSIPLPEPLNKIDLLFLMYYQSRYFDLTSPITFELEYIDHFEKLKPFLIYRSYDRSLFANFFYLEGLCRLAEFDVKAATVLESFKSFARGKIVLLRKHPDQDQSMFKSFFPICAFKLFKGRTTIFHIEELYFEAVHFRKVSDENLISVAVLNRFEKFYLRCLLAVTFELKREKLFKLVADVFVNS